MLSESAVAMLAALVHRPDAEWEVNILPFGSIYWKDEMPSLSEMVSQPEDMSIINLMFGLRLRLWDDETLNAEDRELWDEVQRVVPQWALFSRLPLSPEQRLAREEAERRVEQAFGPL